MGARVPPSGRPRRGGISCEFCGRAVPSASALHTHQASLHSQALKEKAKLKLAPKSSKVQKPETRKVYVNKGKGKLDATTPKTPIKKLLSDQNISKSSAVKPKTEASKTKTEVAKPKTEASKPKTEVSKLKTEAKPKIEVCKPKQDVSKVKVDKSVTKTEGESLTSLTMGADQKANDSTPRKVRKVEYKCPKCEKLFPVLFVAQKHIQKHHCVNSKDVKVAPTSPDIIQPILLELCIYCNVKFSKPHHCPNRPDPNLITYDCLGCEQRFKSNKLFDVHVADLHGDEYINLFFHSEECEDEFLKWKREMESQTGCEYVLMGKYNSKHVYRCEEYTDNDARARVLLCPSTIIVAKSPKGLQIHFYPSHYGHEHNKYELKDRYKTFSVTDLIQQAGSTNSSSDDDLYLQFKTLMESVVLEAAKINIGTLKTLMSNAKDMMCILQEYDEDEEVETVANRSTISLSTSNTSLREEDDSKMSQSLSSRKRGIEENGTSAKKIKKEFKDTKILVKSTGKKSSTFSLADDKDSDKILKELDSGNVKANNDKTIQSPSSFNDSYKDFIMNVSKAGTAGKKKNIVKTKMGQFKGPSPKKINKRHSISTTKDIEYEVRERDEDCNILVLKI